MSEVANAEIFPNNGEPVRVMYHVILVSISMCMSFVYVCYARSRYCSRGYILLTKTSTHTFSNLGGGGVVVAVAAVSAVSAVAFS